jgi:hypothetical protein
LAFTLRPVVQPPVVEALTHRMIVLFSHSNPLLLATSVVDYN